MGTRYSLLRDTIAYFAAPAREQLQGDLASDDAVNDFDNWYGAPAHMLECGEISQEEIDLIRPLDVLITRFCLAENAKPNGWMDELAMFADPLWEEMRRVAANILSQLPDEERDSDYLRSMREAQRALPQVAVKTNLKHGFWQRVRHLFTA